VRIIDSATYHYFIDAGVDVAGPNLRFEDGIAILGTVIVVSPYHNELRNCPPAPVLSCSDLIIAGTDPPVPD